MRAYFIGLLAFALAVGLALSAKFDPGNVVFFFPPYRVDLSINLFAVIAFVTFLVLFAIVRVAQKTMQLPARVADYRQRQREKRAFKALRGALQAFFEGRYGHAEAQARDALQLTEAAGLASLIAALSAHRMTEYVRRDEWLRRADSFAGLRAARLMTEAECLVDAHDGARALDAVSQMHAAGARHIQSLRLALKANQYAGHWEEVLRLLKTLGKRGGVHPVAARHIRAAAYRALLDVKGADSHGLRAFWHEVPAADRRIPDVALVAARAFNANGQGGTARSILEDALSLEWDPRLVGAYAECVEDGSLAQIDMAERWLSSHPSDAYLEYVLGVLCIREKLWGKARSYLEAALKDARDDVLAGRIHVEMARMFETLGDAPLAAHHFREAALAKA